MEQVGNKALDKVKTEILLGIKTEEAAAGTVTVEEGQSKVGGDGMFKLEQDISDVKEEMCGEYFELLSEDKLKTEEFSEELVVVHKEQLGEALRGEDSRMAEKKCFICDMAVRSMQVHLKLNHKKKKQRETVGISFTGFPPSPSTKPRVSHVLMRNIDRITMRSRQCPECKAVFFWAGTGRARGQKFSNREFLDHVKTCGL